MNNTEIPAPVKRALDLGWSVIPCRRDKRPCLPWKKFQNERATEEDIRSWQAKYSPPAWGVITGSISGLVALDFDGEAGERTRTALNPHFQFDFGIPTFQRSSASLLIGDRALSGRTEANT